MNTWLEKRKVSLGGVLRPIKRERKPRKCNNCYRYNHVMEDHPNGKQRRKCGCKEHLVKDCDTSKETMIITCLYCRETCHVSRDCETQQSDERVERTNHGNNQNVKLKHSMARESRE